MRYVKTLGLAVVAAAALMALAGVGTSSATVLCMEKSCEKTYGPETKLHAELAAGTEASLKSSFIGEVKCKKATTEGKITNAGGATETVKGTMTGMTFTECNATVTVLKTGTVEAHTHPGDEKGTSGNGTSTASGSETTVEIGGVHCVFTTSNTDVGTIVGGEESFTRIESMPIPRTGGRSGAFCGSSASMTATYTEPKPGAIYVK